MRVPNTDLAGQLEGRGRIRVGEESLELGPLDTLLVEPEAGSSRRRHDTPAS